MYSRVYGEDTLTFEASGGLLHNALVMQDRETNSYWAIMLEQAVAGKLKGLKLRQLPYGQKMRWRDWVKKHPDTLVLSVDGREDAADSYAGYFVSPKGFRDSFAKDNRLHTKDPVFAFTLNGKPYAVPFHRMQKGTSFVIDGYTLFFYRERSKLYEATHAFQVREGEFRRDKDRWIEIQSGCVFNPETGEFEAGTSPCPTRLLGFDTFWYIWSATHPDTQVLK